MPCNMVLRLQSLRAIWSKAKTCRQINKAGLIYADDVVLLSWSSAGLQRLLNSMQAFCNQLGLTISSSKTEVMVFNGISADTWFLGEHALPRSTTFKYLGLIFHESGDMCHAFARLAPAA